MPPTVDNLLAQGSLGSAVELLEAQIKEQPGDFELQLQLVKVYAIHCGNMVKAEKIIGQLELASKFSPEQIAQARQKLKEWRAEAAIRQEPIEKLRPSN
jgi:protein involved in temperature-dependent protein secretion